MDWEGKSIRVGALVVCCAVVLRLFAGGGWERVISVLTSPEAVSTVLFFETGRIVRPIPTEGETAPPMETVALQATEETVASTEAPVQAQAVFSAGDVALVEVNNVCGLPLDLKDWLTGNLSWDLTAAGPTVLIIHSHGTESYENAKATGYRSQSTGENMVAIGDRLVQVLEAGGVKVVHDRTLHDSPSYSDSYGNARESIAQYLEKYPTIHLVLDLHRDAVEGSGGEQLGFTQGGAAQIMLVVGSDAGGLSHPNWPENMSLAVKLHAQLEKNTPGICRPISFRSQRFNQDLSPGALIVEVGAAGNTQQEAILAVELLGQAVIELAQGAVICE